MSRQFLTFLALVCLLDPFVLGDAGHAAARRSARVDDLFASDSIGLVAFSSDGQSLAFARTRPALTAPPAIRGSFLREEALSDVWLQDVPGRAPRNLTNGQVDRTAAWEPLWAPDGARLAFLSTRGGSISLWVWERTTGKMRRMTTPGVKYVAGRSNGTFQWLDARRILCLVDPNGGNTQLESYVGRRARLATAAWARAARGDLTASVLKSTEFQLEPQSIWLVDVVAAGGHHVGTTVETIHWPLRSSWPSPDGRMLAFVRPVAVPYNMMSAIRMGVPAPVTLQSIEGRPFSLDRPLPENIHAKTLKWSPDGKELAFFANGQGPVDPALLYGTAAAATMPPEPMAKPGNPAKLFRVNIAERTVVPWGTGAIDLGQLGSPEFFWTAAGELLVSAPRRQYGLTSGAPPSRGAPWGWRNEDAVAISPRAETYWWVIQRNGETRVLAPEGTPVPTSLQPVDGGAAFVGIRNGDVWRVDPNSGSTTNLTMDFAPRVLAIALLVKASAAAATQLVLRARVATVSAVRASSAPSPEEAGDEYYQLDLTTGSVTLLASPGRAARLVAYAPQSHSAAYRASDRESSLWRTDGSGRPPELVVEANTFVREIEEPSCRTIQYSSLNGEPLRGLLCLPAHYTSGRSYPLIAEVYYGMQVHEGHSILKPRLPRRADIFTSAGYAYLEPSIPVRLTGTPPEEGDASVMTINGILPAVERAVSLGIADPQRLFIYGLSRGAWTTLMTVGLTTRFKAAVSDAYGNGGVDGTLRHDRASRYETAQMQALAPNGHMKSFRPTDVPWWRDGDLFRRNDPLTYVDRVQTPVMLIHGDLDPGPFELSEDYFYALVSMRRPAEFVRYWGEGHGTTTLANVRDKYQRIFAWFDRWGDIARDAEGALIFDGDRVKSRGGAAPLSPEDFARIGPAAPTLGSAPGSR